MQRILVWDKSFKRSFKKLIRKNSQLQDKIFSVLAVLEKEPFAPSLKAHKLRGNLEGLWACWVAPDCRIIYKFEREEKAEEEAQKENIVLIDIGSHDEVY